MTAAKKTATEDEGAGDSDGEDDGMTRMSLAT